MSLHYLALTDEQLARIRAVLEAAVDACDPSVAIVVQSWPRRSATLALTATVVPETKTEQAGTIPLATLMRARRDLDEALDAAADPYVQPRTTTRGPRA